MAIFVVKIAAKAIGTAMKKAVVAKKKAIKSFKKAAVEMKKASKEFAGMTKDFAGFELPMQVKSEYKSNAKEVKKGLQRAREKACHLVGAYIEAEAKARAPVDTGDLRSSIHYITNEKEGSVTIGATAQHSVPVEYGTSKQPPQAFLTPAIKENRRQIEKLVAQAYKEELGKRFKKRSF